VNRKVVQPIARMISGPPPSEKEEVKDINEGEDVAKEGCDPSYGGQEKASCVSKRPTNSGG